MRTIAAIALASLLAAQPAHAFDGWHLLDSTTIPSGNSGYDYITIDTKAQHLFIGHRKEGLQVFDIATKKLLTTIAGTPAASSNGATLMPEFDLGISNNENGTIIPFKLSTLEAMPAIKLGDELDTSHYDPATKRIIVNMAPVKDATDAVVLEVPSLKQAGVIKLPTTKMEAGEGDGKGSFFVAARDANKVFKLDPIGLKLLAEYPTPGCAQTNGLSMDTVNGRIMLGCRGSATVKPSFAVMDAADGKIIYTAEIGGGNDGVIYAPALKRIFLANGVGAVLNVFEQTDADTYKPVESLATRGGVKVLAFDPASSRLYSMVAEGSADAGKKILTAVSPFYANTFFANTFTVLTYSK
jgi:hypothetical protein